MFELDVERYGSLAVARFSGDMTLSDAVRLRQALEDVMLDDNVVDLVLDLEDVGAVDHSGLGALVAASTIGRAWGKQLMIFRPADNLKAFMEKAEILTFFPMLDDENDLFARIPE